MRIFKASPSDLPRMAQCAIDCCNDHGEENLGGALDLDHYLECWRELLESGDGVMILAEDGQGKVVAGIGGMVSRVMLTGKKRAGQLFWYVAPEHRSGLTAIRLLNVFEEWAKSVAEQITMPVNEGMGRSSDAFFNRRGYRMIEKIYRKNL